MGRYVFGDFGTGNIWNIARDTAPTLTLTAADGAVDTGLQIASFGQDDDGELYIVHLGGTLHRLVQAHRRRPADSRRSSRQTGCVNAAHSDSSPRPG